MTPSPNPEIERAESRALRVIQALVSTQRSGYFFSNVKTWCSVDFGLCPLMAYSKETGRLAAPVCKGCYSATNLNLRPNVRAKIEALSVNGDTLPFAQDCADFARVMPPSIDHAGAYTVKRLRFYSFGDFHASHAPYITTASRFFTVDVLSKTLSQPHNRTSLESLIGAPNVWVSLSFNKDYLRYLDAAREIIKEAPNIQLNYTSQKGEVHSQAFLDQFSVHHIAAQPCEDKSVRAREAGIPLDRVCGVLDRQGWSVPSGGACGGCTRCHVSYAQTMATNH